MDGRKPPKKAILALEDGSIFAGHTTGISKTVTGELVFNTAMTGYQEVCTDPSYARQIVLFTTSHIGNVGVTKHDNESLYIWPNGLIVREMSKKSSQWRKEGLFTTILRKNRTPWVEGIDTRKLVRHIQKKGTMGACIMVDKINTSLAISLAQNFRNSSKKTITLGTQHIYTINPDAAAQKTLLVYDFGVKSSILNAFSNFNCALVVVPPNTKAKKILSMNPDGIIISNGPGDPASMQTSIKEIKLLISSELPILGVCLGCQLIALAAGSKTKKMKFGHHGINHPVYDMKKNKVFISSQNHNFAIDETTLSPQLEITHISLFDKSVQGIRSKNGLIMGFQGHPEGSPGPTELQQLFRNFFHIVLKHATKPRD